MLSHSTDNLPFYVAQDMCRYKNANLLSHSTDNLPFYVAQDMCIYKNANLLSHSTDNLPFYVAQDMCRYKNANLLSHSTDNLPFYVAQDMWIMYNFPPYECVPSAETFKEQKVYVRSSFKMHNGKRYYFPDCDWEKFDETSCEKCLCRFTLKKFDMEDPWQPVSPWPL